MDDPRSVVYLNGQFLPRSEARLDIEDRGALFGDGVYEVLFYWNGKPLGMREHLGRLHHSLTAIRLPAPAELPRFAELSNELVLRNGLEHAKVYWQITRGAAHRHHAFPDPAKAPLTVLMIAWPIPALDPDSPPQECRVILLPDERWAHCHVKSLMLLPNVLAKQQALDAGAEEAVLHRGGVVTEGSSTNVFAVHRGELWTHPADQWILPGVTRAQVIDLARSSGIPVREATFTVEDLLAADEVFITGTTTHISAVVQVDDRVIGAGKAGPVTLRVHAALMGLILSQCRG